MGGEEALIQEAVMINRQAHLMELRRLVESPQNEEEAFILHDTNDTARRARCRWPLRWPILEPKGSFKKARAGLPGSLIHYR